MMSFEEEYKIHVEIEAESMSDDIKNNVTLPNWLNQEEEKSHINVSKVLQEALMAKLGVSR